MTKEPKAMAAVNLFGVLGSLQKLCELDNEAKEILKSVKSPVSLCFSVKNCFEATFHFTSDGCKVVPGDDSSNAKMTFSTPEAFNDLVDNSKPGFPSKNPIKTLSFLSGTFTKLTNRLSSVLQPAPEALKDRAFFEENTLMTLYVVGGAISQLANYDSIGKVSAYHTVDGKMCLGIKDGVAITITVKDNIFSTDYERCENPRAFMEFADLDLTAALFNGTASSVNEVNNGRIRIGGMISMCDNVNRLLSRVSVYLG